MSGKKSYIAVLVNGVTRDLVFSRKDFTIDALVFLNKNDDEARFDISEMAWQDRAEWISTIPFRAYPGWTRSDVVEMEELLKDPAVQNIYIDY